MLLLQILATLLHYLPEEGLLSEEFTSHTWILLPHSWKEKYHRTVSVLIAATQDAHCTLLF
jgi:hypothetical protein